MCECVLTIFHSFSLFPNVFVHPRPSRTPSMPPSLPHSRQSNRHFPSQFRLFPHNSAPLSHSRRSLPFLSHLQIQILKNTSSSLPLRPHRPPHHLLPPPHCHTPKHSHFPRRRQGDRERERERERKNERMRESFAEVVLACVRGHGRGLGRSHGDGRGSAGGSVQLRLRRSHQTHSSNDAFGNG